MQRRRSPRADICEKLSRSRNENDPDHNADSGFRLSPPYQKSMVRHTTSFTFSQADSGKNRNESSAQKVPELFNLRITGRSGIRQNVL